MSLTMTSAPTDWDVHKDLLSSLYRDQNWSLARVAKHMETHYGFIRSPGQYERQFRDKWGWTKYDIGGEGWRCIGLKMRKRKRAGRESEVVLNGVVQPSKKVRKELQRHVPELAAYPEDGPSPTMPPKIEVRTPVAMTGSHPPEMRRPTSTGLQNHMKDSLGLILPSITRLPSFIGLEVLQEAFLSRMTMNRFKLVDGPAYPSGATASFDRLPEAHENHAVQGDGSIQDAPDSQISVWCNTGILQTSESAQCTVVRDSDAIISTFDMTFHPIPISGVERSTLQLYHMLRRIFVLHTSKQLAPESGTLKGLLPLLKSPLSQTCLKELAFADEVASQDFVETLLYSAICAKNSSAVAILLRLGCDPNQKFLSSQKKNKSLLWLAAETGELSVVKVLVEAGARVNGIPPEGEGTASPLIAAVDGNFLNVVEFLIQCGSRLFPTCKMRRFHDSALVAAARQGNAEMARLLLTAHTHSQSRRSFLNRALAELTTWDGVRSDQDERHEILEMLLGAGADPGHVVYREKILRFKRRRWSRDYSTDDSDDESDDESDYNSNDDYSIQLWTALESSAKRGHLDFVEMLSENGAQVTEHAVLAAIESRHADLACFLVSKMENGSLDHPRGYELLRNAIDHKDAERNIHLVKALLDNGVKPNKYLLKGLSDGSGQESDEAADCDPMVADILARQFKSFKASPLEIAAERGHIGILNLLLSGGAQIIPPEHPHYRPRLDGPTILDRGAKSGKIEIFERLLEVGADIPSSKSALVHAIEEFQSPDMVWRLIQGGADVNLAQAVTETTPLQAAVRIRNLAIIQMLLGAGANKNPLVKPYKRNGLPSSALCDAIEAQDHCLMEFLLQLGANVNGPPANGYNTTALQAAVENEDLDLVFKLLHLGSEPNDPRALLAATIPGRPAAFLDTLLPASVLASRGPDYGCAALQVAIQAADHQKVHMLLQSGVRCDTPVPDSTRSFQTSTGEQGSIYTGLTALGSALMFDGGQCGPMLRMIFATAGMNPNAFVDYTPRRTGLQLAVSEDSCDLAQFMIASGADVNLCHSKRDPSFLFGRAHDAPICIAVDREHTEMVQLLLSAGARVDTMDQYDHSLLTLAASRQNLGLVQVLLNAGATVNANGSNFMCTALEAAAMSGSVEVVQCLLRAGANASGPSSEENSSALCCAVAHGYLHIVRILLEAGADASVTGSYEQACGLHLDYQEDYTTGRENISALQFRAALGSIHTAALLVGYGADVNARARVGEMCDLRTLQRMRRNGEWLPPLSSLEEAAAHGNLNMLQLLLDAGARTTGDGARQYKRSLGYAQRKCNYAAVKLLKKHHAAEVAWRKPEGSAGPNGLQGGSEAFPW